VSRRAGVRKTIKFSSMARTTACAGSDIACQAALAGCVYRFLDAQNPPCSSLVHPLHLEKGYSPSRHTSPRQAVLAPFQKQLADWMPGITVRRRPELFMPALLVMKAAGTEAAEMFPNL